MNEKTQGRFTTMGKNIFLIVNRLVSNQKICRLIKYQVRDPFSSSLPDINGDELLNKQIMIVPKIPDSDPTKTAFIVALLNDYDINTNNPEFKLSTIRFDIACPFDEWVINDSNLRPYLIMQEIDLMFNEQKIAGIGNLEFFRLRPLVLSPQLGGFTMRYKINDLN